MVEIQLDMFYSCAKPLVMGKFWTDASALTDFQNKMVYLYSKPSY